MSLIARPWARLTLAGKIALPLLFLLALMTVALLAGWQLGVIPAVVEFVAGTMRANIDIVRFITAATVILLITVPIAFVVIFFELKFIALMNLRIGPNRIGPWGTLHSVLHGLKVLAKEDFTPTGADAPVFTLAPVVVYLAAVLSLIVVPFAPGLLGFDMNIALLYFFAISGMSVVGLMMAGWSSFNKYSLIGGLRAAAQVISYELPLVLAPVGVVMLAGTLSINGIVEAQAGSFLDWFIFQQPLAFLIFFVAAAAEGNRAPFDQTEADSEIVAGFATEYSGMRFGFFFFAEYVGVFVLSALTVLLFFGGWHAPIDIGGLLRQAGVEFNLGLDLGGLGVGLLFLVGLAPVIGTLLFAIPLWMVKTDWSLVKSLIVGFVLFNVALVLLGGLWLTASFSVVLGLLWFLLKAFFFCFVFVWMRATLPRVRIDQLMSWAWKWLIEAAVINIFLTAGAIIIIDALRRANG